MSAAVTDIVQPLDQHDDSIRVVVLQPATDPSSQITCNSHTISVVKDQLEPYEALSYAWEGEKVTILVDEVLVQVSHNLKEALRQLRYPDRSRYLWIDATSITQTPEGIQNGVPRILSAFKGADRVLIWLGPEEDNSRLAMEHLRYLATEQLKKDSGGRWTVIRTITRVLTGIVMASIKFCIFFLIGILATTKGTVLLMPLLLYLNLIQFSYIWCFPIILSGRYMIEPLLSSFVVSFLALLWFAIPKPEVKVDPDPLITTALSRLFERKWFTRTWIIQEVVAAKDAVVWCGSQSFPWSTLVDAVDMIDTIAMSETGRSPYLDCMYKRVSKITSVSELNEMPASVKSQREGLLYLATIFSNYDATAPQDKINGVLGLSNDKTVQHAHKERSAVKVFTDTTKYLIESSGNLDVLRACLHRGTVRDLPSWVPDWTTKDLRSVAGMAQKRDPWLLSPDHPSSVKQPIASFSADLHRMTLQGVIVAKLKNRPILLSYSVNGGFLQLSENLAPVLELLDSNKAPDGKIPLSSTAWTASIIIILGKSAAYSGSIVAAIRYIPGVQSLLSYTIEKNPWGFGFFFNTIRELVSMRVPDTGHFSRRGAHACSWEGMALDLNPENSGSTYQSGWNTIMMRKGVEVDSSKSRFNMLSTYAADARPGDLVVVLMGAKVPFIIRPLADPDETPTQKGMLSLSQQHFRLVGPASWGGFALDTVFWNETREAFANGEHKIEPVVFV